jgi:hypothetical protein
MVAEHRRRQEEDLMQMVFRLNAAVQHQGGQVVSSEDAGAQRQGGQVVSADLLEAQRQGWQVVSADKIDAQGPGSQQLATGQPAASTAVLAPVPGMRSGVRVVHPPGSTLLQMNAVRHVASIFTSGPVFGKSPTQRAQDFQAFTADTIQTFMGPSSSAGSASDPINIDITNKKRTDRAGGSVIEVLESENTQEQLRTGQVNAHVLVLHVSWHYLLMPLIHLHVLYTGTDSLFCMCSVMQQETSTSTRRSSNPSHNTVWNVPRVYL